MTDPPRLREKRSEPPAHETESSWDIRLAQAEALVTSHPGLALAVAAGVGLVFGWWMKRK